MNSSFREREKRNFKRENRVLHSVQAGFGFLCKKWAPAIRTRVTHLIGENQTARAVYPLRPSGPLQLPAFSSNFDG